MGPVRFELTVCRLKVCWLATCLRSQKVWDRRIFVSFNSPIWSNVHCRIRTYICVRSAGLTIILGEQILSVGLEPNINGLKNRRTNLYPTRANRCDRIRTYDTLGMNQLPHHSVHSERDDGGNRTHEYPFCRRIP